VNAYDIGDLVTLSVSITVEGKPADPDALTLTIARQDGEVLDVSPDDIVRDDVGQYHYDYVPDGRGVHTITWRGTGAARFTESQQIYVR